MRIVGKVVNPEGDGVPFTAVGYSKPGQTAISAGTTANEEGKFNIEVPANGNLQFSSIGYSPKTFPIGSVPYVVILNPLTYEIPEALVVTEKKQPINWLIVGPALALIGLIIIKKTKS